MDTLITALPDLGWAAVLASGTIAGTLLAVGHVRRRWRHR